MEMLIIYFAAVICVIYGLTGVSEYVKRGIPRPDNVIKFMIAITFWPYIIKQLDGDKDE